MKKSLLHNEVICAREAFPLATTNNLSEPHTYITGITQHEK
jgi:hypothetical protein